MDETQHVIDTFTNIIENPCLADQAAPEQDSRQDGGSVRRLAARRRAVPKIVRST